MSGGHYEGYEWVQKIKGHLKNPLIQFLSHSYYAYHHYPLQIYNQTHK